MFATRLAVFIATVCYAGYFPIAPGTVGSAAGLLVYLLVWWTGSVAVEVGLIVAVFAVGVWAASEAERHFGGIDPGPIVIDEVVGMLITGRSSPSACPARPGSVLFRVFDVIKPFPAGRLEQLHGGLGVMADDAMAAVYESFAAPPRGSRPGSSHDRWAPLDAEVIAVGSELLGSTRLDTNSLFVAEQLAGLGIELRSSSRREQPRADRCTVP